ncbi:MAG: type II toxin-antitoxin system PemK/MazF family toxin [Defluviitaleaceae bacterium]|nr:type II toxin-antitoxin system PemK/MazF family toxin [Defluviitaleaceae bacterium]
MRTITYKGEIWLAYDDKSNKVRPFLIVADQLSGVEIDVSVAPSTTAKPRNAFDIDIEFWKEAGLIEPSVVCSSKVHLINHVQLKRKVGKLDERDMIRVNEAMRRYFNL